jgi:hypothetical protein
MTIQPVGNHYQSQKVLHPDYKTIQQSFGNLMGALKSGNQEQISLSGSSLAQAIAQYQTDLSTLQQTAAGGSAKNAAQTDFQSLLSAVSASIEALKSGNQDQVTTSQEGLQKATSQFQTDLSGLLQNNPNTTPGNAQTDFENMTRAITALLEAQKSGNQEQIAKADETYQKAVSQIQTDLSTLQQTQGTASNSTENQGVFGKNNLLSYLAAALGYGGGLTQGLGVGLLSKLI